jgi:dTMP kinase
VVISLQKAHFITLEGGEGVGKSTLHRQLADWLRREKGLEVVETREPGGTPSADEIRRLFKSPPEEITSSTEAMLVSAARCQHVQLLIRPSLARGAWVVCDRFADSTRVYQGLFGGVGLNDLEWLIRFSTDQVVPELTFLLDCDVDLSMQRVAGCAGSRDDSTRFDQASRQVHERLRAGFRKLAGFFPSRFYILDASQSAESVLQQAKDEMNRRFFSSVSI